ncbi:MAG: homoprotocatechuate degradation operon regulator HpaR [Steroidobacteraceae bacterium]
MMNRTRKSEAWVDPVFHNSADMGISAATRQLPVLLHRAREALAMHFRKVFIEHELTDPQWRVLRILNECDEIDVSNLARRSYLMGPSLSRILRDLTARGLIVRRVSSADARRFFHALTPRGRRLLSDISPEFNPVYRDLELRLGLERIRRLNASLAELLEVVQIPPDRPEGGSARGIGSLDGGSGPRPRRRSAATER